MSPGLPLILQCRGSRPWQLPITAELPHHSWESAPRGQVPTAQGQPGKLMANTFCPSNSCSPYQKPQLFSVSQQQLPWKRG